MEKEIFVELLCKQEKAWSSLTEKSKHYKYSIAESVRNMHFSNHKMVEKIQHVDDSASKTQGAVALIEQALYGSGSFDRL